MTQNQITDTKAEKQRITAFIDSVLVKRAKVRGALEGFTISEIVEKALEDYAPKIENGHDKHILLKFVSDSTIATLIPETDKTAKGKLLKNTKRRIEHR